MRYYMAWEEKECEVTTSDGLLTLVHEKEENFLVPSSEDSDELAVSHAIDHLAGREKEIGVGRTNLIIIVRDDGSGKLTRVR